MHKIGLLLLLASLALGLAACGGGQPDQGAPPSIETDGETAVRPQFIEFYANW